MRDWKNFVKFDVRTFLGDPETWAIGRPLLRERCEDYARNKLGLSLDEYAEGEVFGLLNCIVY